MAPAGTGPVYEDPANFGRGARIAVTVESEKAAVERQGKEVTTQVGSRSVFLGATVLGGGCLENDDDDDDRDAILFVSTLPFVLVASSLMKQTTLPI